MDAAMAARAAQARNRGGLQNMMKVSFAGLSFSKTFLWPFFNRQTPALPGT
jgi:hypothetical protein